MFPTINRAFQWLSGWSKYPRSQAVLIRKIVDRIRNSLELQVVLQAAVDEVSALLELDYCSFLWYFQDTQRVQIVCERNNDGGDKSLLGYHPLESFGDLESAIAAGELIINNGTATSSSRLWRKIANQIPWRWQPVTDGIKRRDVPPERLYRYLTTNHHIFGYCANLLIPVPVTGKDGAIGFIACFSTQPRIWTAAEIEFLESLVEPLEIAIRQAQLYKQTQKQAIRERLVNQITTQTRQSFDPETILTEASRELLEALQADRCLVHLIENTNNSKIVELNPESAVTTNSGETFHRKHLYEVTRPPFSPVIDDFDTKGPITQWVIQHRQSVMIPDVEQDTRIGETNTEYRKAQIKSTLVVPVQANGKLHAILHLNQCSHIRYWSKDAQQLAIAVADQLAISLQQAYLYARTQQQAHLSARQAQKMSEMLEELRLTQAQLIQSEKMSSLGRMVAGVAHEINNPVNFIYGNVPYVEHYVSDLIRLVQAYKAHYPDTPAQVQKLAEETDMDFILRDLPKILKSMESGSERIHEIVQLLQKFSGTNAAPLKVIDLHTALESTLLMLHNQIIGTIKVERDYDKLPPVECYPRQFNQALLGILTNAIEALNRSPNPNKIITLCTKWLPIKARGDEEQVQITIKDNGPGIKLETQPKIFEPFFTTKDVGQGRGLGLTVSYQTVVNQHKGQLEVISQADWGAEFIIKIPVRQSKRLASDPPAYKSMSAVSQAKVLVPSLKSVATAANG